MTSHWHDPRSHSQNVGNVLGARPCVRQSRLYREYESGNATKSLLGHDELLWAVDKKQGAYEGQPLYDHATAEHNPPPAVPNCPAPAVNQQRKHTRASPHSSPAGFAKVIRPNKVPLADRHTNSDPVKVQADPAVIHGEASPLPPAARAPHPSSHPRNERDLEYQRVHAAMEHIKKKNQATTALW